MFVRLFLTFLKIGTFTLGGGYAMLPLIQKEVVERYGWIDEQEFLNMIALAQAAPGIIAVNTAVFIGNKIYGWRGVLAAVLGAVLPSFCIILAIASVFRNYKEQPVVEAVFKGVRPAVVALIAAPLYKMTRNALRVAPACRGWQQAAWLLLPIGAALLIWAGGVSPVLILAVVLCSTLLYTYIVTRRKG